MDREEALYIVWIGTAVLAVLFAHLIASIAGWLSRQERTED